MTIGIEAALLRRPPTPPQHAIPALGEIVARMEIRRPTGRPRYVTPQHSHRFIVRYSLKTLLWIVTLAAVALTAHSNWDAIPGTYHKNENGFARGTGVNECHYDNGALMIREWYFRGLIYRSTWFLPDGRELATETYNKATGGVGYYLRQDGAIRSKYTYEYMPDLNVYGNAGGPVFYDLSGTPVPGATKPLD